jgi:hypothetical protein
MSEELEEYKFPETGIYLRVKRGEKFNNVLLEDLTKEELKELFFTLDENGKCSKDNMEEWMFPVFELLQNIKAVYLNEQ